MWRFAGIVLGLTLIAPETGAAERGASLRGSPASMQEQNRIAREHSLPFYRSATDILEAVARGDLVELRGNENYAVADFVRFPFLHPDAALFVERLAAQYREACGQRLVVTSGVRPSNGQPANAHALSVHPAGMAVDLRVSDRATCRSWLEASLLAMERQGLLNGIREFRPPHYHIAVFPDQYRSHAEARMAVEATDAVGTGFRAMRTVPKMATSIGEAAGEGEAPSLEQRHGRAAGFHLALGLALAVPFGFGLLLRRRR